MAKFMILAVLFFVDILYCILITKFLNTIEGTPSSLLVIGGFLLLPMMINMVLLYFAGKKYNFMRGRWGWVVNVVTSLVVLVLAEASYFGFMCIYDSCL